MARIAGIDIPNNKRGVIALTYIFGIGKSRAQEILTAAKVDEGKKVLEEIIDSETIPSYIKDLARSELSSIKIREKTL